MKYEIIIIMAMLTACEVAPEGPEGIPGELGESGVDGDQGDTGDVGPQGPVGPEGPQGEQGEQGDSGVDGTNGEDGARGATGATGPQGEQGPQGSPGRDGESSGIVLYDSSGNPIDFVFELTNLGNYEMFKIPSNCILVKLDDAGRPIDMAFDLATGDTMPCMSNRFDSWSMSNAVYLDENCSGNTYTLGYGGDEIVAIQGATYYPVSPAVSVPDYYGYENGTCLRQGGGAGAYVYRYEPVPTEILNLMPDPPYTIE